MMRVVIIVGLTLAALVTIVLLVGSLLPVRHQAMRSVRLTAAPDAVYRLIEDVAQYPTWRTGVTQVEVLARDSSGAPQRFREQGGDGTITYDVVAREPDRRMATRIVGEGLPFGGQWAFALRPDATGTTLTITEDGEVYNPVFRFVSRFILGHTRSIDRYLADAARRFPDGAHE